MVYKNNNMKNCFKVQMPVYQKLVYWCWIMTLLANSISSENLYRELQTPKKHQMPEVGGSSQ
jgi:hypothetical protein